MPVGGYCESRLLRRKEDTGTRKKKMEGVT
jgi:hypothetical protein